MMVKGKDVHHKDNNPMNNDLVVNMIFRRFESQNYNRNP